VESGTLAILNRLVSGDGTAVLYEVFLNHNSDLRGFAFRQPSFVANPRRKGVVHF